MVWIVVGVGNTNCRVAAVGSTGVEGEPLVFPSVAAVAATFARTLGGLRDRHPEATCVLCSVVPRLAQAAGEACRSVFSTTPIEVQAAGVTWMKLHYEPVSALGADRLCVVLGTRSKYGYPSIAVDFGTAVTVNVLDGKGDFVGGCIFPGLEAALRALHTETAQLPHVDPPRAVPSLPARSTGDALRAGAYWSIRCGVEGIVRELRRSIGSTVPVILTGGGAALFGEMNLGNAVTDKHLLFYGAAEYARRTSTSR